MGYDYTMQCDHHIETRRPDIIVVQRTANEAKMVKILRKS